MRQQKFLFYLLFFLSISLKAQLISSDTTYFKSANFWQKKKKSKFLRIENSYKNGLKTIVDMNLQTNDTLNFSSYQNAQARGIWKRYNTTNQSSYFLNFEEIKYATDENKSAKLYENDYDESPLFKPDDSLGFGYIAPTMNYPAEARDAGIMGTVYIRIKVDEAGNVSPIHLLRGVNPLLDVEVWKVIKNFPNWDKVGYKDNLPVDSYFVLPVKFALR